MARNDDGRQGAQGAKPTIPLKGFNNFRLNVSDVKRSVDFYQGLFGMPIQARQGETVILRIGSGPHEYQQPSGIYARAGGGALVYDAGQSRFVAVTPRGDRSRPRG